MTARGDKTHRNQSQELKYTAFWGHSTQEQRMLRTVTASEGTANRRGKNLIFKGRTLTHQEREKLFYWLNLESRDMCNTFGDSFHWKLEKLVPGEIILLFKKLSSSK